jgi:hypothetical protein
MARTTGYTLERACTRHDQRASSPVCGASRVSGNTSPMQKKHLEVKSPSFVSHSSQADGTSLKISAQSWKRANGHRSRVNGYVCGKSSPFPNLGRNLFPPRRFSCGHRISGVQWHSVTTVTRKVGRTARPCAQARIGALYRCSNPPRCGHTK